AWLAIRVSTSPSIAHQGRHQGRHQDRQDRQAQLAGGLGSWLPISDQYVETRIKKTRVQADSGEAELLTVQPVPGLPRRVPPADPRPPARGRRPPLLPVLEFRQQLFLGIVDPHAGAYVGTREVDCPAVAGGGVPVGVLRLDGNGEGGALGNAGRGA